MDVTKDNGNGASQVSCDRYPGDCPLVDSVRRLAQGKGSDEEILEYMKDPEKLWQALNDLEVEFGQLTNKIDSVADEVSRVARGKNVGAKDLDRMARWQGAILIAMIVIKTGAGNPTPSGGGRNAPPPLADDHGLR